MEEPDRSEATAGASVADSRLDPSQSSGSESTQSLATPHGDEAGHQLAPGDLLAGRFQIIRSVGQGGMGDVFEADDLTLHTRVALKTIRPDLASSPAMLARLRREVLLARRVSHRNICRIFDFHEATLAGETRLAFISMEFLDGETLAARLLREPSLSRRDALLILQQVAEGLAAIHAQGIVHRDLKPGNVLLLQEPAGLRAVLTDFGIARASQLRLGDGDFEPTRERVIVGTPRYMAPEQLRGDGSTYSSDVYSFALVASEVLDASVPKRAGSVRRDLRKALSEDPSKRPGDPRAIVVQLERGGFSRRQGRRLATGAVLVLMAGVAAGLVVRARRSAPAPAEVAAAGARPVALLGITSAPDDEDLGQAIVAALDLDLRNTPDVLALSPDAVQRRMSRLRLGGIDVADAVKLAGRARLNEAFQGAALLWGTVRSPSTRANDEQDLELELTLLPQGKDAPATVHVVGSRGSFVPIIAQASDRIRALIGSRRPSPAERRRLDGALPRTFRAAERYGVGRRLTFASRWVEAVDAFSQCVREDPHFQLCQSEFSWASSRAGMETPESRDGLGRAHSMSEGLPEPTRLLIETRYAALVGHTAKAKESAERLFSLNPADYGAFDTYVQRLRPQETLALIDQLRASDSVLSFLPAFDFREVNAATYLRDERRMSDGLARLDASASAPMDKILVSLGLEARAMSAKRKDKFSEALAYIASAEAILTREGDYKNFLGTLTAHRAEILWSQGEWLAAIEGYEKACDLFQRLGTSHNLCWCSGRQAYFLGSVGRVSMMEAALQRASSISEEVTRSTPACFEYWSGKADLFARKGEFSRAQEAVASLVSTRPDFENSLVVAYHRATIAARQDRVAEARSLLEKQLERELVRPSEFRDRDQTTALLRADAAALAVEVGDLAGAEKLLASIENVEPATRACALKARALLAIARHERRAAVNFGIQALAAARASRNPTYITDATLALAAARMANGEVPAADTLLEPLARRGRTYEDTALILELELVRLSAERKGRREAARKLSVTADAAGFTWIARKASEIAEPTGAPRTH